MNPLESELFSLGLLEISTSFSNLLYMAAVLSFQGAWQALSKAFFQPCRRRKINSRPVKKQPGIQQPLPREVQVAEMSWKWIVAAAEGPRLVAVFTLIFVQSQWPSYHINSFILC